MGQGRLGKLEALAGLKRVKTCILTLELWPWEAMQAIKALMLPQRKGTEGAEAEEEDMVVVVVVAAAVEDQGAEVVGNHMAEAMAGWAAAEEEEDTTKWIVCVRRRNATAEYARSSSRWARLAQRKKTSSLRVTSSP